MNKKKEIEEMTEAVMCAMEYREKTDTPNFELIAQNLINTGYGNVKQAVKEFAEKAIRLIHEHLDNETDYTPSMVCRSIFDNLITELYGADE